MHQRLRMHQHADGIGRQREQVVGLDHLQPLVHQGGGIDRDLRPHRPFRVHHRLRRGHRGQRRARPAAERAAGGGQGDPRRRVAVGQALEDRVVLAVDRDDGRRICVRLAHQQLARQHQRFLVGQQQALARARGGQRRGQPGGADDRGHHGVAGVAARQRLQCFVAGVRLGVQPGRAQAIAQGHVSGRIGDHRVLWPMGAA